jgi:hypothetical protein
MECAYAAYSLLREFEKPDEALEMQALAARLGHPFAVRNEAIDMILGRRGITKIPLGLSKYIVSVPRTIAYAKSTPRYRKL